MFWDIWVWELRDEPSLWYAWAPAMFSCSNLERIAISRRIRLVLTCCSIEPHSKCLTATASSLQAGDADVRWISVALKLAAPMCRCHGLLRRSNHIWPYFDFYPARHDEECKNPQLCRFLTIKKCLVGPNPLATSGLQPPAATTHAGPCGSAPPAGRPERPEMICHRSYQRASMQLPTWPVQYRETNGRACHPTAHQERSNFYVRPVKQPVVFDLEVCWLTRDEWRGHL